jgi:hypothetical protein
MKTFGKANVRAEGAESNALRLEIQGHDPYRILPPARSRQISFASVRTVRMARGAICPSPSTTFATSQSEKPLAISRINLFSHHSSTIAETALSSAS